MERTPPIPVEVWEQIPPGSIADPAAIDSHVDDLAADLRYAAVILVLLKKDPPRVLRVLTPIGLGPVSLLTRLDYFGALCPSGEQG